MMPCFGKRLYPSEGTGSAPFNANPASTRRGIIPSDSVPGREIKVLVIDKQLV